MNTLTIIVLCIFGLCTFLGYKRGLFKSAFRLILAGLTLLLAYFLAPIVGSLINGHTQIDQYLYEKIYAKIDEQITIEAELTKNEQIQAINELQVPQFIKTALIDNNYDEAKASLGVSTFVDYVATYISYMIINAVAFVITFLVVGLILRLVALIISIVMQLPILNGINRFGGIIFGLAEALFIVWFMFVILILIYDTELGSNAYKQIMESKLLTWINGHNIFMPIIGELTKII